MLNHESNQTPGEWWEARRFQYNLYLAIAGLAAFACYVIICSTLLPRVLDPGEIEISLFTTAFQAAGYLFMMGVANVCFFLGPLSERIIRPADVGRYRRICYRLGFWFSVGLPFSIPIALAVKVIFFPASWKH